ncbi:MAG: hypothetical protein GYB68_16005 [Chloroflexi bacterium]|nr:hypothetical protein [Chloroflexota bacterium]
MGRIADPTLRQLAEQWSPTVTEYLNEMGTHIWPPKKVRRWPFDKPKIVPRFDLDGPIAKSGRLGWSISHTLTPSAFTAEGTLTEGKRAYWIVWLHVKPTPVFEVVAAQSQQNIPAQADALKEALRIARKSGPVEQTFYGNKGPFNHVAVQ